MTLYHSCNWKSRKFERSKNANRSGDAVIELFAFVSYGRTLLTSMPCWKPVTQSCMTLLQKMATLWRLQPASHSTSVTLVQGIDQVSTTFCTWYWLWLHTAKLVQCRFTFLCYFNFLPSFTVLSSFYVSQMDYTNSAAVKWYQEQLQGAVDLGFYGWMYDYGEYTPPDSISSDGTVGETEWLHTSSQLLLLLCGGRVQPAVYKSLHVSQVVHMKSAVVQDTHYHVTYLNFSTYIHTW